MISLQNNTFGQLLSTRTMTSAQTASASIDCVNADYAVIAINFKSAINTSAVGPTISLLSSDDTVVTNHATIVANVTQTITNASQRIYYIDRRASKRYLRLTITSATATNDDISFGAVSILGRKKQMPSSTAAFVGSTNDAVTIV